MTKVELPAVGPGPEPRRLERAAREFEALLLASLLKSMHKPENSWQGPDEEFSGAAETLRDLGVEAVAQAWAARGGLGIGDLVRRSLGPALKPSHPGPMKGKEAGAPHVR